MRRVQSVMKKWLGLLIIFSIIPFSLAATHKANVQIIGVRGKLLTNIQTRLQELSQKKALQSYSPDTLKLQVTQAMHPYGYFRPQISVHLANPLQISINSGPRLLFNRLDVQIRGEGVDNHEIIHASHHLPIQQGKPFNSVKYENSKQILLSAAEHEGYLHAHFITAKILIDRARYTSVISLIFDTGPQYYFGKVQFNPTYISPDLLQRYIPFKFGEPYSTEKVLAFNSALAGSNYFNTVSVKPDLNRVGSTIPINVYLQSAKRVNYSLGLGYGTDTGARGRVGIHVIPVNRAGHKFNAVAIGSINQNILQTQYIIPGKNPLIDEYSFASNLANLDYNAGHSNSLLMNLAHQHKLATWQRTLSLNALYEQFRYMDETREKKLTLFPKLSVGGKKTTNQLFSPSGYNVTFNGLIANKALLSQVSFTQASVDARAAITTDFLATRFYFHAIQGITQINDVNQLPLSLALLLGGADNLKAYSFNSLGPGKILSFGSMEIQKETFDKWYLIGFFDSGDVYKPSLLNWQHDVGVGLMWVSPVGPIKVGIAQAIDSDFHRIPHRSPKLVINMGPDL